MAECRRSCWKIENETFNTLKTKGYNLEHSIGHGQANLAAVVPLASVYPRGYGGAIDRTVP